MRAAAGASIALEFLRLRAKEACFFLEIASDHNPQQSIENSGFESMRIDSCIGVIELPRTNPAMREILAKILESHAIS